MILFTKFPPMLISRVEDLEEDPKITALWDEIEKRDADDELFLLEEENKDEPLSQDEIDAWDMYLSSPEGIKEAEEYFRANKDDKSE